ncbi:hypothetical protein M404DRAFT_368777 [Pisolithus tinctorius Marx 270]|uniref:Uncharacterized protein n=1 Tax=Pisolithus tinctorius Marx 270 TaxID=870435 RepID=A0A0C3NGP7_PISTI|nr:hypothetical protein M404DRAFT_368777 [Pisolithus tinctorius Marx 270]
MVVCSLGIVTSKDDLRSVLQSCHSRKYTMCTLGCLAVSLFPYWHENFSRAIASGRSYRILQSRIAPLTYLRGRPNPRQKTYQKHLLHYFPHF